MLDAIPLVIALAADYSIETRIRRLMAEHRRAGSEPRVLVMNPKTWHSLVDELHGTSYSTNYFWISSLNQASTQFLGVPILIKDFVADEQVLVGV